ncbi:MAG: glycosyltransferase family 4 protein [Cellulophaga sp.]
MKNPEIKNIAIVVNTSWNIYNFRLGLLKTLKNQGNKVFAIAPKDNYSTQLEEEGIKFYPVSINNKGTGIREDLKLIFDYYKLFKEIKPDLLLHYTIKPNVYGTLAAGLLGIPVISTISGLGTVFLNENFSSKIARLLYKISMKIPSKVFFQNPHDRDVFLSKNLVDKGKTTIIPGSGVDTNKFKPLQIKKKKNEKFIFLMIARLVKDKGIIEYVDAARVVKSQFDNVEFWLLGSLYPGNPTAISQKELDFFIEEGNIKYLGHTDDVQMEIEKADCVVLPSYREGLSRVLLEASSMEKPIITTDVPGCSCLVDNNKNGYLCEVKNSKDLAQKMEKMLRLKSDTLIKMGQNGRQKILKEFDEVIVINKYIDSIKSTI